MGTDSAFLTDSFVRTATMVLANENGMYMYVIIVTENTYTLKSTLKKLTQVRIKMHNIFMVYENNAKSIKYIKAFV